jgi:hypothetical protein
MVSVSSPLSPLFDHCESGRDGLYDYFGVATGGSSGVLALLNVAGVGDPHDGCSFKDEKTHIDQAESYVGKEESIHPCGPPDCTLVS